MDIIRKIIELAGQEGSDRNKLRMYSLPLQAMKDLLGLGRLLSYVLRFRDSLTTGGMVLHLVSVSWVGCYTRRIRFEYQNLLVSIKGNGERSYL